MAGVEAHRRGGGGPGGRHHQHHLQQGPPPHGGSFRGGGGGPSSRPSRPSDFEPIDREKTCPLLLRVFTKIGGHHVASDFAGKGNEPKDEVQIYTWKDATLRELSDLVKEVAPEARRKEAELSFAFVYPQNGRFRVVVKGSTFQIGRRPDDGNKTLASLNFQIGDYLDVAIKF